MAWAITVVFVAFLLFVAYGQADPHAYLVRYLLSRGR